MADENTQEQSTGTEISPERQAVEEQARSQGWVPQDEWQGSGKWRDAEEFVERGELFGKIDSQGRALKQTREALTALQEHYHKMEKVSYEKALRDLKAEKKEAIASGDSDRYVELEEQIEELKDNRPTAPKPAQQQQAELHPEFVSWVNTNQWYAGTTPKYVAMRAWADQRGNELAASGLQPREVLAAIAKEARTEFPGNFSNPARGKPSNVEGGGGSGAGGRGGNRGFELTDMEKQVMRALVKSKTLTEEQYIADIRKQRGVQ